VALACLDGQLAQVAAVVEEGNARLRDNSVDLDLGRPDVGPARHERAADLDLRCDRLLDVRDECRSVVWPDEPDVEGLSDQRVAELALLGGRIEVRVELRDVDVAGLVGRLLHALERCLPVGVRGRGQEDGSPDGLGPLRFRLCGLVVAVAGAHDQNHGACEREDPEPPRLSGSVHSLASPLLSFAIPTR
jgi:hypothetical protein